MSRLFHTERGRLFIAANEELGRWRWAKKILTLPPVARGAPADLWLFVQSYGEKRFPLRVEINGRKIAELKPTPGVSRRWSWIRVAVPKSRLRSGKNEIVLSADNSAMNGWLLGIENTHEQPLSFLSTDRGATWRNHHMGAHGFLRGEYLVRLRVHHDRLRDAAPPPVQYENPKHPRVRELKALLPASIKTVRDPWQQLLALRAWVATRWVYENIGTVYSPWDPWTLLDWCKRNHRHGRQQERIAFCVHYGVCFAMLASALGHRARGVAVTPDFVSMGGHFMAEVWDMGGNRWVLHDPNYDLHYEKDGVPLSAADLCEMVHRGGPGGNPGRWARRGPGVPRKPAYLLSYYRNYCATGDSFRMIGAWTHNQVVSDPTAVPPNHGACVYTETDFVWYAPAETGIIEAFPYRVTDRRYFDAPPSPPLRGRGPG